MRYVSNQFNRFFQKQDWNVLLQNITTIAIGGGLGLYFYETQAVPKVFETVGLGSLFSTTGVATESKPFLVAGGIIICVSIAIKLLIYFSILDINAIMGKRSVRRGIDINSFLQECLTIALGVIIGIYTTPAVKKAYDIGKSDFPDLGFGIALVAGCLFAKALLASGTLNLNFKTRFLQPRKFLPFLGKYNWNEFTQETTSTTIGVGTGMYLYQSGAITEITGRIQGLAQGIVSGVFGEVQRAADSTVGKIPIVGSLLKKVTDSGIQAAKSAIQPVWTNPETQPYLIAGLVIIGISVLVKLLIYCSILNVNSIRDFLLGQSSRHSGGFHIDTKGIVDEIVTFALTTAFGIIAMPILKNVLMDGKDPNTPWIFGGTLILILAWLKLALIVGALQFGSQAQRIKVRR